MYEVEQNHNREHKQSIKNEQVSFIGEQRSAVPLKILDHSENRPHHDEQAGSVHGIEMLPPGKRAAVGLGCRDEDKSSVKADGDDHEETEEGELHEESDYDDVGSHLEC